MCCDFYWVAKLGARPSSEIMLWSDITAVLSDVPAVDFCFSDEDFSQGKQRSLWLYVQRYIVVAIPARQPPAHWYRTPIQLSHYQCGGAMFPLCMPPKAGTECSPARWTRSKFLCGFPSSGSESHAHPPWLSKPNLPLNS